MTQLERELQQSLKLQEQMFKEELQSIATTYENELKGMRKDYLGKMSKAMNLVDKQTGIIEKQSQTLSDYEKASRNIRIRLDDSQVTALTGQVEDLKSLLTKQENAFQNFRTEFNSLGEQLETLERKL